MPPRSRARAAKTLASDDPAPAAPADPSICQDCWPDGWPEATTAAVCDHGSYTH